MKTNMRVKFKESYTGYFDNLKGQTFTVDRVIPGDREGHSERLTVLEIDEIHLIYSSHFNEVSNEPAQT